jgi:F-type H+-transporting ATPase subunit a
MTRFGRMMAMVGLALGLSSVAAVRPAAAQEHTVDVAREAVNPHKSQAEANQNKIDITHHIGNSREIELPFGVVWHLPRFEPIHLGGLTVDLSPTKHMVFMVLSAILVGMVFVLSARSVARAQARGRPAKGFAGAMEATALYIRQEVILPNVGHHGEGFVPYLLTLFFFILTMNLFGLFPWGATATGNIAVTGALALMAFITIEIAGMRALGPKGYLQTIFYLPPGLPTALKPVMLIIMTPVEIIGKLSKPFALAVRLFANMTAGHVLVLALIGLTFLFQSYVVGLGASVLATAIMLLELFVAFLQAFVFTLLTSVFIGLMRAEH